MPRIIQLVVFIIVPIANYLLAFSDGSARFDDDPQILNDPAGYAFAIWGPIFIGMIYYSYRMWRDFNDGPLVNKAAWAGISAGLASIAFVPISMTDMQWLVLVNILWHLISLIQLYRYNHEMQTTEPSLSNWTYVGPQMYLGWISAATTISVALALRSAGMSFASHIEVVLTIILIITLSVVAGYLAKNRGMVVAMVVIWALVGIIVKHGETLPIRYAAVLAIMAILAYVGRLLRVQYRFI